MIPTIASGFFDELAKMAAANPLKVQVPNIRQVAAIRDPGSAGYIKPQMSMRIAGGARNMGVTRPPTSSSARTDSHARQVRAVAGRRPADIPAPTPVP